MTEIPATRDKGQLKYWGFISYSHSDKPIVRRIQKKLEAYRIPGNRVGTESPIGILPRRLRPFFRDEDALPMSPDLAEPIQAALRESRSLVVICSPRSAKSDYVNAEVEFFTRLSREERYACIIIEGKPHFPVESDEECFCRALRIHIGSEGEMTEKAAEPLGGNVRNTSLDQECIRVIATVTGIPFDELWNRFKRDRNRRILCWIIVILSIGAVMVSAVNTAIRARNEAVVERERADEESESRRFAQYLSFLSSAETDLTKDDLSSALSNLELCPEILRDWEWFYLANRLDSAAAVLESPNIRLEAVDISSSELMIAAGTTDGRVVIWDRDSRKVMNVLEHIQVPERVRSRGDVAPVKNVDFSSDGTRLLSASENGRIVIWETTNFTIEDSYEGSEYAPSCWLPDSRDLVRLIGSSLVVWDTETNSVRKTMEGTVHQASSIDLTSDGRFLAIADWTSSVRVWDTQTGKLRQKMNSLTGGVYSVAIHPTGDFVAGGTESGTIIVWSIETATEVSRLTGHAGAVNALDWKVIERGFERFDQHLASGGEDASVMIWEPIERQLQTTQRGHQGPVSGVVWAKSGRLVGSCSRDASVRLWIPDDSVEFVAVPGRFNELQSLSATQEDIFASVVKPFDSDPNGAVGNTGLVRWRIQDVLESQPFGDSNAGHAIALKRATEEMTGLFEDGTIRVWNTRTLRMRASPDHLPGTPVDLAVSPSGSEIWACSEEGDLWVWDLSSLVVLNKWRLRQPLISSLQFFGNQILTTSIDGSIRLWDSSRVRLDDEIACHTGAILSSCVERSGQFFCTSGTDGQFAIHSNVDRQQLLQVRLLSGPALSLSIHPDGKRIAAGHLNGSISILDANGILLLTLRGHRESVDHLQFAEDGVTLVSASSKGIIRLWRAPR